ncbi:hypothetical protein [Actinokineospora sp. UTMC 2448]|uniref:hypothetical protein n=1 Tax=Actinokineospora sp. UTMC 2448 TaxID=2268449 RepID=UPI002164E87A|nr:hypothetical protein [Actinokineospora sp. UTMC 2448]
MRVPPVLGTPAGQAGVVALMSVLMAVLLALFGAYGMWSVAAEAWETTGKVTVAVSCADPGREEVEYVRDGAPVRAELDACGHREGEEVALSVTDGEVHLGSARTGATTDARVVGVALAVLAGMAGAGFVALYRRG